MALRKGKTKSILNNSIDSALLAVEIYNKPRTTFKVENYILLMIIAWTKLFHAYFQNTIGEKYFYKGKNGRYKLIDGEKKAWELSECIKEYGKLSEAVETNLKFFIGLRNKIAHRYLENQDLDVIIFGECQSLLYNYENMLVDLFGDEYSINENLAYALQFSHIRTKEQQRSQKNILSNEIKDLHKYIQKYRNELQQSIFDSNEYSIKLIQIPKISNTNRNDLAIEFVNWNSLSEEDKENYSKVTAIIKDKVVKQKVLNANMLKPSEVINRVDEKVNIKLNFSQHTALWKCFKVRPLNTEEDRFDTDDKFCIYDEVHNDYLYTYDWVNFIVGLFTNHGFIIDNITDKCKKQLLISDYS